MALKSMEQFLSRHPDYNRDDLPESYRNRLPMLAHLASAIFLVLQTPEAINNFANASPEQKQQILRVLSLEPARQALAFHYASEYAQYVQDYRNDHAHPQKEARGIAGFFKRITEKFSKYPQSPYERYMASQKTTPQNKDPRNTSRG